MQCWQQLNGWQTGILAATFLGKGKLIGICARIRANCRTSSDTSSFECSSWPGFQQVWEAALRLILLELSFSWYLIWMSKTWLVSMCTDAAVHPCSCSSGLATSLKAVSGLALVTQRLKRKWHLGESLSSACCPKRLRVPVV